MLQLGNCCSIARSTWYYLALIFHYTNIGTPRLSGLLLRLHTKAAAALNAAYAPQSKGPLTSAIRAFARFARACPQRELFKSPRILGDPLVSAWNEWTFILFATYLSSTQSSKTKKPLATKTIETYISLLKGYLGYSYAFDLMERAPRLKRYLAALKNNDPSTGQRRKRRGLRRRHLRMMWQKLSKVRSSSAKAVNEFALLATAWHVLARGGELAPSSFDPRLSVTRADLQFCQTSRGIKYAVLWLRPLKKKGSASLNKVPQFIQQHDGNGSDVYAALKRLVFLDPVPESAQAHTPLFRNVSRMGKRLHFTTSSMRSLIRARMKDLGYSDYRQWGAQSCRIGGATDLASTGRASQLLLQAKGRWSSDIGKIYARMTRRSQLAASRLMQRASGRDIEEIIPEFTQPA